MNRYFLDTNIFIYSLDSSAPDKQLIARDLIKNGLQSGKGCVSYQVVQEFYNVTTKKFREPLRHEDILEYIRSVLIPMWKVHSSIDLFEFSMEVRLRWGQSIYDSIILASAFESRSTVLYSEDFSNGQEFALPGKRGVIVKNPFD